LNLCVVIKNSMWSTYQIGLFLKKPIGNLNSSSLSNSDNRTSLSAIYQSYSKKIPIRLILKALWHIGTNQILSKFYYYNISRSMIK
jgi:hypothetical protein